MTKKILASFSLIGLVLLLVSGCAHRAPQFSEEAPVFNWLQPTHVDNAIAGKAFFWPNEKGVKIRVVVTGAEPGKHGMHIHEGAGCGNEGKDAGGHFNPDNVEHGLISKDGPKHAHPGDMGNIEIGANGEGETEMFIPGLFLDFTKYGIAGRTLIIHEKQDDFSQPTGNAGGREACMVIPNPPPKNCCG